MSRIEAFLRFLWDFVVGDDWRIALGAAIALGATALVSGTGVAAWWILPVVVAGLLSFSVLSAAGRVARRDDEERRLRPFPACRREAD